MDFQFVACKRSAKLVKYNGTDRKVVIPAFYEGKPVIEIGPGAFASNYNVNAVILPTTVERIEVNAFGWARNLSYIATDIPQEDKPPEESTLPASVRTVGAYAFNWNYAMKKLIILGKEVEIDDYAFASSNIEEIYLPNCTDLILRTGAFAHCKNLKRVSAAKANIGMVPACCFEGCLQLHTVEFVFSAVDHHAFHGCLELKKIRLPKTLIYSEPDAFTGCTHLMGRRSYLRRKEYNDE